MTIENTGDGPLKLGKLELSSPVQFGLTLRDDSEEIASGGTCALTSAGLTLPEGAITARMLDARESITIAVRAKAPLVSGSFMGSVLVLFEGQAQTSVALTATTITGDCLKLAPNNWGFGSILGPAELGEHYGYA